MADYIKREDVLSLKHRLHNHSKDTIELYPVYVISPDAVEKIPSADVAEVKHGKWVNGKCSECGEAAPYSPMRSTYYRSLFCPNCGADMRSNAQVMPSKDGGT